MKIYKCAMCKKEFISDYPEEKAWKEAVDLHGADIMSKGYDPVCDGCFKVLCYLMNLPADIFLGRK